MPVVPSWTAYPSNPNRDAGHPQMTMTDRQHLTSARVFPNGPSPRREAAPAVAPASPHLLTAPRISEHLCFSNRKMAKALLTVASLGVQVDLQQVKYRGWGAAPQQDLLAEYWHH